MADAQMGDVFLIKIGSGAPSETFTAIAALRSTSMAINNSMVDITNKDTGSWRALLNGGGVRSMTLSGDGVFTGAASHTTLRTRATNGTVGNFQLDDGVTIFEGPFQVASFEQSGDAGDAQMFSLTLESAGPVETTPAPEGT